MHVRACQHNGCGYLSTQADCTTHFTHCTTSPVWFRQVCTTRSARFTLYEQTTLWRITLFNSRTPALLIKKAGTILNTGPAHFARRHRFAEITQAVCLYISWIIRRQKGNPKGLDLKAHEAHFNNDRTDESFVSYTRGASQSLCD